MLGLQFNLCGLSYALVLALCVASAVAGRLVLTAEEARRTITVRAPALLLLLVAATILGLFAIIWAIICFAYGSFYGLVTWWLPAAGNLFENVGDIVHAITTGRWE